MSKFTFKTEKPTGRYKSFYTEIHYIKLNGKEVGTIDAEDFRIRLQVIKADIGEDGNRNCPWKWIKLAVKPESLESAKEYLNENFNAIKSSFNIYLSE